MNVNNFFRFIGEKFPQYKLSGDNETLKNNFFESYERDVTEQDIDDDNVVSLYFAVENESTMDENGKNGKFIQYSAEAEQHKDSNGERDINFRHYKNVIDFKNDVKVGNDELYEITYSKAPKKLMNTEYKNGKMVKKVRFRYFYEVTRDARRQVNGPYIQNITHYDNNENEVALDVYRYISYDELGNRTLSSPFLGTRVRGSEISYRKILTRNQPLVFSTGDPIEAIFSSETSIVGSVIYFDTQANEISKGEWDALMAEKRIW